jgi:hypothetical protein
MIASLPGPDAGFKKPFGLPKHYSKLLALMRCRFKTGFFTKGRLGCRHLRLWVKSLNDDVPKPKGRVTKLRGQISRFPGLSAVQCEWKASMEG